MRPARAFRLVAALLAWAAAWPAPGQIASARATVERAMASTVAPGAQIAVPRNGKLVWSESLGCADLEQM